MGWLFVVKVVIIIFYKKIRKALANDRAEANYFSTVFFIFETLSLHFFYLTLLRILLSSAVTLLLVYFCQRLFSVNRQKP